MKSPVLLLLVLAGLALGSHQYRVLKLFASGVISGISGPEATVPETCFDTPTCISVEDSLIRAFTDLVRGSDTLAASQVEIVSALQNALHSCGFDTCAATMAKWNSSSEQLRLAVNFAMTLPTGGAILGKVLEAAQNYHWEEFGYNLGKYWKLLNEGSGLLPMLDTTSYFGFLEGVVLGLSRRAVETHPCYDQLMSQSKHTIPLLEGLYYSYIEGDNTKLDAIYAEIVQSSDELYNACKLAKFMENVVGRLKSGSYTSFGSNIMMNMSEIRAAYEDMKKNCGEKWKECGMNVGKVTRLLLGWSI